VLLIKHAVADNPKRQASFPVKASSIAGHATMPSLVVMESPAKTVANESNVFYTFKLKRNNKKKSKHVMLSDHYQKGPANRVAVISPLKRKKSKKSTIPPPPLPPPSTNHHSSHPFWLTDNDWKQQYWDESQSLLRLYMKSDSFHADTTYDHMPIRVNPERIHRTR
jgi:hypothetical protein